MPFSLVPGALELFQTFDQQLIGGDKVFLQGSFVAGTELFFGIIRQIRERI